MVSRRDNVEWSLSVVVNMAMRLTRWTKNLQEIRILNETYTEELPKSPIQARYIEKGTVDYLRDELENSIKVFPHLRGTAYVEMFSLH